MVLAPIGKSRYAELNGVRQYLGTQEMADHFNSAAYEFDHDARRKGTGRRLVANEGFRDEDRCLSLFKGYKNRNWAPPKVATPLTSNHYVGARAVDIGIMTKDGVYDVPTDAEFSEIHALLAAHGFYWAGQNFGEAWHHEYVGGATKPVLAGVNQAGDPYYKNPESPDSTTPQEDELADVHIIGDAASKALYVQNNATGGLKQIESSDAIDLATLVNQTGRLTKARINALNERYLRPISVLGMIQAAVNRNIIPGKKAE
jgi:hypothetical protein